MMLEPLLVPWKGKEPEVSSRLLSDFISVTENFNRDKP